MSHERGKTFGCRIVGLTFVGLLAVLISTRPAHADGDVLLPGETSADNLYFEPIEGLTTVRHLAPRQTAIPLGLQLRLFLEAPLDAQVSMTGAIVVGRKPDGVSALCPLNQVGPLTIRGVVQMPDGTTLISTCKLNVVSIPISEIAVTAITPSVAPFDLGEGATNEATMAIFFGESIATLRPVAAWDAVSESGDAAPRRRRRGHASTSRYQTSIDRTIRMVAEVNPIEFKPVMEWRVNGSAFALGSETDRTFYHTGTHSVEVGPPAKPARLRFDTYSVSIVSHSAGGDFIAENEWVTFEAVTIPAGFENGIRWVSSTKYGIASPVIGQGSEFTVLFSDTLGRNEVTGDFFQWLGVKADNAVVVEDVVPEEGGPQCEHEIEVPGTDNGAGGLKKITIKETAAFVKGGNPGKISYTLVAKNTNACIVKFVICGMVNVEPKKPIAHTGYEIDKVDGNWTCMANGEAPLRAPSYHMGCKRITLSAAGNLGDEQVIFNEPCASVCFAPGDNLLKTDHFWTYVDILKDCFLTDWLGGGGQKNIWLEPADDLTDDVVSVWVPSKDPIFDEEGNPLAFWAPGNWFTMGQPTLVYPAEIRGTFFGLPPSSPITLTLPGEAPFAVSPGAEFVLGFDIPPLEPVDPNAVTEQVTLEWNAAASVAEGHAARFSAIVTSGAGAPPPYSAAGEFMYTVERALVQDTVPPNIVSGSAFAEQGPDCLRIGVAARDDTTYPVVATAVHSEDPGTVIVLIPQDFVNLIPDPRTFFVEVPFVGALGEVEITVTDELRNERIISIPAISVPNCQ